MDKLSVTHLSTDTAAALAFARGEEGADRRVLERVAEAAILEREISGELQRIANLLLANVLFTGKLPSKVAGRPKSEKVALRSVERSYQYYELQDRNEKGAANKVAEKLPIGARQVERDAPKYEWLIGQQIDDRNKFRAWRARLSKEEYESEILFKLRRRNKQPAVTSPPANHLASAPDLVEALRMELIGSANGLCVCPLNQTDFRN